MDNRAGLAMPRVRQLLHATRSMLSVELQASLQYRVANAVWSLTSLLQMVVYLSVWQAVADARGGEAGGFTPEMFAGYFMVLVLFRELTFTWVAWELETLVNQGKLSPLLLRPIHPLLDQWVKMLSYKLQSVVMLLPITAVIAMLFGATLDTTITHVLIAMLLIIPASLIRFTADASLATLAFWLTRIGGPRGIYYVVLVFLAGQFAPLAVLPGPLQEVARALPFYWALGYPVELAIGTQPLASLPHALMMMALWICLCGVLLRVLWHRGITRYGAVGA
jgi:ABC-2 type transport system permease protein